MKRAARASVRAIAAADAVIIAPPASCSCGSSWRSSRTGTCSIARLDARHAAVHKRRPGAGPGLDAGETDVTGPIRRNGPVHLTEDVLLRSPPIAALAAVLRLVVDDPGVAMRRAGSSRRRRSRPRPVTPECRVLSPSCACVRSLRGTRVPARHSTGTALAGIVNSPTIRRWVHAHFDGFCRRTGDLRDAREACRTRSYDAHDALRLSAGRWCRSGLDWRPRAGQCRDATRVDAERRASRSSRQLWRNAARPPLLVHSPVGASWMPRHPVTLMWRPERFLCGARGLTAIVVWTVTP